MSSWVLVPISLLAAPAAGSPPVTAEQAMAIYRQRLNAVPTGRCTVPERPDELVVCARRPDADRLPLPVEPEPGAPPVGETGAGRAQAAAAAGEACLRLCPQPVGIDVIGTAIKVTNALQRLIEGED